MVVVVVLPVQKSSSQSLSCNICKVQTKDGPKTQDKNRCLITLILATARMMGHCVGLQNMH